MIEQDIKSLYYFLVDSEQLESIDEKFTGNYKKDEKRFKKYTNTKEKIQKLISQGE